MPTKFFALATAVMLITASINQYCTNSHIDTQAEQNEAVKFIDSLEHSFDSILNIRTILQGPYPDDFNILWKKIFAEMREAAKKDKDFLINMKSRLVEEMLERILETVVNGCIIYVIPDTMIVDAPSRISVSISKELYDPGYLKSHISELIATLPLQIYGRSINSDSVNVSDIMKVRLIPWREENCKITELNNEVQLLTSETNNMANWQWDILPLKSGELWLTISVEALVKYNGEERSIKCALYDKGVFVNKKFTKKQILIFFFGVIFILFSVFRLLKMAKKRISPLEYLKEEEVQFAKLLIKKGDVERVVEYIEANTSNLSKQTNNMLTSILSQWQVTQNNFNIGIITNDDLTRIHMRSIRSLLGIINKLEKNFNNKRNKLQ